MKLGFDLRERRFLRFELGFDFAAFVRAFRVARFLFQLPDFGFENVLFRRESGQGGSPPRFEQVAFKLIEGLRRVPERFAFAAP